MVQRIGYRTQIAISFFTSVFAGYMLSRRDDGDERIKMDLMSYIIGAFGTVIGYRIGKKRDLN